MAYLPLNARSEFVRLLAPGVDIEMNFSDGCVFESSVRFQAASRAPNQPALSPTRGSGRGAVVDMSTAGAGTPACVAPDDDEDMHAAKQHNPLAAMSDAWRRGSRGRGLAIVMIP